MLSVLLGTLLTQKPDPLLESFKNPPAAARPWVYWYFMEGNMTREGLTADLESMKRAGIGGAIMLEVNIGIATGPVRYMSPEWRKLVAFGIKEADRLGIEVALGTGPGWCGTGGPWVAPEDSMQTLVASETTVEGPKVFEGKLAQPKPRVPYFGMGSMNGPLTEQWKAFYRDEAVVAIPVGSAVPPLADLDEKALYYRAPYTSGTVKSTLTPDPRVATGVAPAIDLTSRFRDGTLTWTVPPGKWTILRFGRTLTGTTTRPAPNAGLGFETDKFEKDAVQRHLSHFIGGILRETGTKFRPGRGLTTLHFDSWEMSSQNWSPSFRSEFRKRRGYDPYKYLPVYAGKIVGSVDRSERFLWDMRQTAQELVVQNHIGPIRRFAGKYGLVLDIEPYDMNPTSDMVLGGEADVPMCEFWSKGFGFDSEYSVDEATSIAHTTGKSIVGAEAFTSDDRDAWLQHPASMKAQGDWALASGVNRFAFHRYQHQPDLKAEPGMTMGPYGVHWERTQTFWDMVPAYHRYLTRCQNLLRQGIPVADILYLVPEGAPNVFQPPADAKIGRLPDRRGYNFDGISPDALMARASAKDGKIVLPNGVRYQVLVLPRVKAMTPALVRKIKALVDGGAKVIGNLPTQSPSLSDYPTGDREVARLAKALRGKLIPDREPVAAGLDLKGAKWIWSPGENGLTQAKVGERRFKRTLTIPNGKTIVSARVLATADNSFQLNVNGKPVAQGFDFHHVESADVAAVLRPGLNELEIVVENEGDAPNPAGAIVKLVVQYKGGSSETIVTDGTWSNAEVLGDWQIGPWSLNEGALPRREQYPSYASTARYLSQSIAPDVESGEALRYGHRRVGNRDVYFVGNRSASVWKGKAAFRAVGQPAWWDPMTGTSRLLPEFTRRGGVTEIPLRLDGNGSGFIVFGPSLSQKPTGKNFSDPVVLGPVTGPWRVDFGGTSVNFARLSDWKDNPDQTIRHFSGKAVYRTTFDGHQAKAITLGEVKNMASVRINGRELGVVWTKPWSVAIPSGLLKKRGNVLEVTVANLWSNRLIGDAGLPAEKRTTQVTWSPYRADSPLQPSGLLGPVRLMR